MSNVHFIVDEAASLGPNMTCIEDAIDKGRGYGIRLLFCFQSLSQLKKCHPKEQDQTVLANVTQIFFGVNEFATADYVSQRLGDQTIIVDSGGSGTGTSRQSAEGRESGNWTSSANQNRNWSQMARRLLKPEEVLALDERIAITFVPGMPPIRSKLERYYETRIGSPRFPRLKTLIASILVLLTGTFWLVGSLVLLRNSQNVGSVRRYEEHGAGSQSRIAPSRNSGRNGARLGTVQWQRVRPVRPRPVPGS